MNFLIKLIIFYAYLFVIRDHITQTDLKFNQNIKFIKRFNTIFHRTTTYDI